MVMLKAQKTGHHCNNNKIILGLVLMHYNISYAFHLMLIKCISVLSTDTKKHFSKQSKSD